VCTLLLLLAVVIEPFLPPRFYGQIGMERVRISDLTKQWQVAGIWMRDANVHTRPCRGPMSEIAFRRQIAGTMLNQYFDMVEWMLEQHSDISEQIRR
jgi:hypothetical protein